MGTRVVPALLRKGDAEEVADDWLEQTDRSTATRRSKAIRCAACGRPVTSDSERTAIAGSHVHSRINPAGVEFTFGCFRSASGASLTGSPTTQHTWFVGYSWSFSLCGGCGSHLGWYFESAGPGLPFWGLILERLTETGDSS